MPVTHKRTRGAPQDRKASRATCQFSTFFKRVTVVDLGCSRNSRLNRPTGHHHERSWEPIKGDGIYPIACKTKREDVFGNCFQSPSYAVLGSKLCCSNCVVQIVFIYHWKLQLNRTDEAPEDAERSALFPTNEGARAPSWLKCLEVVSKKVENALGTTEDQRSVCLSLTPASTSMSNFPICRQLWSRFRFYMAYDDLFFWSYSSKPILFHVVAKRAKKGTGD